MQLEIKHIAGRLPYGLKMYEPRTKDIHPLLGIDVDGGNFKGGYTEYDWWNIDQFKPILFPLSALTQEITVGGETFVPIEHLDYGCIEYRHKKEGDDEIYHFRIIDEDNGADIDVIDPLNPDITSYGNILKLLEWHFDIDNLIEDGLAVSVFDLPEKPYK